MLLASVSRIKGSWKSGYVKMGVDVNRNFNSANAEAQSFVQLNGLSCSVNQCSGLAIVAKSLINFL